MLRWLCSPPSRSSTRSSRSRKEKKKKKENYSLPKDFLDRREQERGKISSGEASFKKNGKESVQKGHSSSIDWRHVLIVEKEHMEHSAQKGHSLQKSQYTIHSSFSPKLQSPESTPMHVAEKNRSMNRAHAEKGHAETLNTKYEKFTQVNENCTGPLEFDREIPTLSPDTRAKIRKITLVMLDTLNDEFGVLSRELDANNLKTVRIRAHMLRGRVINALSVSSELQTSSIHEDEIVLLLKSIEYRLEDCETMNADETQLLHNDINNMYQHIPRLRRIVLAS